MEKELAEYGLHSVHKENWGEKKIDIEIVDDQGKVWATIYGEEPFDDVEIECEHPAVEFDDDEHVGECPICGAWATWHFETSADDGYTIKEQVVDTWENQEEGDGIINKYIKILRGLTK